MNTAHAQVGIHPGNLRIVLRVGKRRKPAFRLPLFSVFTPDPLVPVHVQNGYHDSRILLQRNLGDLRFAVHRLDRPHEW